MHNIKQTVEKIKAFRSGILSGQSSPLARHSLRDVKRVVIINSSSRSGSSLLYELLSRLPQVYSLSGEAAPFYKLNTFLNGFNLFESDKIPASYLDSAMDMGGLSRDFLSDAFESQVIRTTAEIDQDAYIAQLMLRISLQWTDIDFDRDTLRTVLARSFDRYRSENECFETEDFYLLMLEQLIALYPGINPFYYDISTDKVALRFPFTEVPGGPPNSHFNIEEPPFILHRPRRSATPGDLGSNILLLKSTVDCYRMNLIEKIFSGADLRIIHLVRNPAGTTNGIYDGWLHRGFFSHNLRPYFKQHVGLKQLSIRGYSDLFPFGAAWWNFDLPEGWQAYADRDLVDVCAFQWRSANAEILKHIEVSRRTSCMVRFEDIIRSGHSRRETFEQLLDFIGVPSESLPAMGLDNLPVVQATLPPQLYRWKKRKDMLGHLVNDPDIRDMCDKLGYPIDSMEDWL